MYLSLLRKWSEGEIFPVSPDFPDAAAPGTATGLSDDSTTVLDIRKLFPRLGKATAKQAESARRFMEDLLTAKGTGGAIKGTTAE